MKNRGYWPSFFSGLKPGDGFVVADRDIAELVCRNAWRRGYTVWRKKTGRRGNYRLTFAHGDRASIVERRARR